jgi:hypothetical protein
VDTESELQEVVLNDITQHLRFAMHVFEILSPSTTVYHSMQKHHKHKNTGQNIYLHEKIK